MNSRLTHHFSRITLTYQIDVKNSLPVTKRYGVGLLGAGTVGGGLIRLIQEELSHLQLPLEIRKVGVRNLSKPRTFNLPGSLLSDDLESIVEDRSIDILVEALGGLEPARTYIEKALRAGKHVITANKYVVSEFGDTLHQLAASQGKCFLYEASVAGSIPIIEILKRGVIPDKIRSISAILNGTTNFILTRMAEAGEAYPAALAKAQHLGFSEPDPSLDVSGRDAAQKLAILISILKGQQCHPTKINTRGIEFLTPCDFQFALERQWKIKPLALYEEMGGKGFATVEPVLVPMDSVLANVRNEYNALLFDCQNVGKQLFMGKGAGELPTASAILSDLGKIIASDGIGSVNPSVGSSSETDRVQFSPLSENSQLYQFYIQSSVAADSGREHALREIVQRTGELVKETRDQVSSVFSVCAVTPEISHSQLYQFLDAIKSLGAGAQVSWLRILTDVL